MIRAVNGYPGSKIANGYLRKQRGARKLKEEEREDYVRDERLPKLVLKMLMGTRVDL